MRFVSKFFWFIEISHVSYLNVEIVVVMFPMHGFLRKENILVDVLNSDTRNSDKNKEIL